MRVNWLTTSASLPTSTRAWSKRPSSFAKMRSRATFPASRSASASESCKATPSNTTAPPPIAPTTSSPTETDACDTRCTTARTLLERVAFGRSRPQRARELDVWRRLLAPALVDERAPEGVMGELVGRVKLDQGAELRLRLLPAADPEVG